MYFAMTECWRAKLISGQEHKNFKKVVGHPGGPMKNSVYTPPPLLSLSLSRFCVCVLDSNLVLRNVFISFQILIIYHVSNIMTNKLTYTNNI